MALDISIAELRDFLQEGMRAGADGVASFALLSRILLSQQEFEARDDIPRMTILDAYEPVWAAFDSDADGREVRQLLERAERTLNRIDDFATSPEDDWVDPTGRLTRRSLEELQRLFTRVVEATRLPGFDWEAHWLNSLVLADGEIAPDFPARETMSDEWAFLIHENGWLASDERIAPGIAVYVGTLMGRAAVLGRQAAEMFHDVYREKVVTHLGVEAAFALTRMELEVIGRARAIITPTLQGQRVKAYVSARLHDLGLAGDGAH